MSKCFTEPIKKSSKAPIEDKRSKSKKDHLMLEGYSNIYRYPEDKIFWDIWSHLIKNYLKIFSTNFDTKSDFFDFQFIIITLKPILF